MSHRPSYPVVPLLKTPLPGPQTAALIAEDEQFVSPSYTRDYPLAAARGEGAVIEDLDGNVFLDFTAGIAVCASGHCHPRIVAAIEKQSRELFHMSGTDFYYRPQRDLAKKLAQIAPGKSPKKVFFTNSGAESVEAALKLARYRTGRPNFIAFYGAFHGRTMGALSLTASKPTQRRGFEPLLAGVHHVDYADCRRRPYEPDGAGCRIDSAAMIERELFARLVAPDRVAAIVVEPIQGEGGYIVPPPDFLPNLRALCDRHGILLVADEVQSGMGRTGRMFACEHVGVEPDILCLAKGIASGLPLGAIVAKADVMTWPRGAHASTFGGNPVACAAALATIELLESELVANAAAQGDRLLARLRALRQSQSAIGDVRGKGLMIGVDVINPGTRQLDPALRNEVVQECFRRGLLILGCGPSAIRLCPPLVVDEAECDIAARILGEAIAAAAANGTR